MQQAESDYRAAVRLFNPADDRTWGQALSKYQQCVEKSVKGVLDGLHAAGLVTQGSDGRHLVARYAMALRAVPAKGNSRVLLDRLRRLFTASRLEQIAFLDGLVPVYPTRGTLARRNHEYPYQHGSGTWHAPSDAGGVLHR